METKRPVDLMKVMERACGHDRLPAFHLDVFATGHHELTKLSGIHASGISDVRKIMDKTLSLK